MHVEYPDPEIHTLKNLNTFGCESLTAEPSQKKKNKKEKTVDILSTCMMPQWKIPHLTCGSWLKCKSSQVWWLLSTVAAPREVESEGSFAPNSYLHTSLNSVKRACL